MVSHLNLFQHGFQLATCNNSIIGIDFSQSSKLQGKKKSKEKVKKVKKKIIAISPAKVVNSLTS